MKTGKSALTDSITAAADLVAKRFIGFDGNLCGADAAALGVSEMATASGEQCPVIMHGIAIVESGGAISQGADASSDSVGRAVVGAKKNGVTLDAASGAGEFIRVRVPA